jgi:hypothetical protein
MANEDDAASMLADLCSGGGGGGGSRTPMAEPADLDAIDIFNTTDGQPIKCAGCMREKRSADIMNSELTLWWNLHGYPKNPARHSKICGYCEFIWRKQHPDMKCDDFCVHCQSKDGGAERCHYEGELVQLKSKKGPKGRISQDDWQKLPAPSRVVKRDFAETYVEEPDELFYSPEQHLEKFKQTPEEVGLTCEWVENRGSMKWGCWRSEEGQLRKKRRTGKRVDHEEEVDNSEMAISADQLAKRFKAEGKHMMGMGISPQTNPFKASSAMASAAPSTPAASGPLGCVGQESPLYQTSLATAAPSGRNCAAFVVAPPRGVKPGAKPIQSSGRAGKGTARKTSAVAGASTKCYISQAQQEQLINECVSITSRWDDLMDEQGMNSWEIECTKVLKTLQKRQGQLLAMECMDPELLDFQMSTTEHHDILAACGGLILAYRAYNNPDMKKKKGARSCVVGVAQNASPADAVDAFRCALDETKLIIKKVPPVFAFAEYRVGVEQLRLAKDIGGFFKLVSQVPPEYSRDVSVVQREFIESFLTDMLRELVILQSRQPPNKKSISDVTEQLRLFLKSCGDATVSSEIKEEAKDSLCLVDGDESSVSDVRAADAKVSAAGVKGIHKIFAALGRKFIAHARENLAESSQDAMLTSKVAQVKDLQVVIRPIDAVQQTDECVETASKALHILTDIARQGSRVFKEKHATVMSACADEVLNKVKAAHQDAQWVLDVWLMAEVTVEELPANQGINAILQFIASAHRPLSPELIRKLELVSESFLAPLKLCFDEKSMNSKLKDDIAMEIAMNEFLIDMAGAWVGVLEILAFRGAELSASTDDFGGEDAGEVAGAEALKLFGISFGVAWSKLQGCRARFYEDSQTHVHPSGLLDDPLQSQLMHPTVKMPVLRW